MAGFKGSFLVNALIITTEVRRLDLCKDGHHVFIF